MIIESYFGLNVMIAYFKKNSNANLNIFLKKHTF